MASDLTLQRVQPSDREEVYELSRDIWEGHDYVPDMFDEWVDEEGFYKGVIDDRIIGLSKYTRQYDDVIWLEGFRIHPDHQGEGYGREMMEKFIEMVKELDGKSLKFMTAKVNEPILYMAEDVGFDLIQRYKYYVLEDTDLEGFEGVDIDMSGVERVMKEEVIDLVKTSPEYEENKKQYLAHWTAYNMKNELISREMEAGRCYFMGDDDVYSIIFLYPYDPYEALSVPFVAGEEKEKLMRFGAQLAVKRDYSRFAIKTASSSVIQVCEEIGMELSHVEEAVLYEMEL